MAEGTGRRGGRSPVEVPGPEPGEPPRSRRPSGPNRSDDTVVKSYRYLRAAMVGLMLSLGVAVVYQSVQQGSILSSISAYYYTPAQAIFVGALVAVGACMIALQGTTETEDVLLNIGGMLAPVVAIVPTARSQDYRAAIAACRASDGSIFTDQGSTAVDCPTVRALADAAQANIDNNMVALLAVGAAGLVASLLLAGQEGRRPRGFWAGFSCACAVWALTALGFLAYPAWFTDNAHYVAAVVLFACIVMVAVVNALRHQKEISEDDAGRADAKTVMAVLFTSRDYYAMVALAMLAVVLVGVALLLAHTFHTTLFWIEASLIALFATFWVIQTKEQWNQGCAGRP